MKEDGFYYRLTNDEQVEAFVKEFERTGLLKFKRELEENPGKTYKEIMIENRTWESFVKAELAQGYDPEVDVIALEAKARKIKG